MKYHLLAVLFIIVAVFSQAELTIEVPVAPASRPPRIAVPEPTRGTSNTTTSTGSTGAAARTEDVLKFRNGDALHGALVSASADEGIHWKREDAKAVIGFTLGNVGEVLLANATTPRAGEARSVVRLTNGDALAGEIVAVTKDALKLRTWYAGELIVKHPMIASIEPGVAATSVLYAGPAAMAEWKQRNNSGVRGWSFKKGALVCSGGSGGVTVGRDVKLPDMASIECDVSWAGYVNFYMLFYADNFENYYNSDCYALQVSGGTVYLQRCTPGRGMNNLEQYANVESLQRKNKARFALKLNKVEKKFALFVDGVMVKQWTDRAEFNGKGSGIGFVTQGQPMRVSNIVISQWDGKLELESGSAKTMDEDLVRLANGDKLSGHLDAVINGQLTFSASYAKLEIPMARVAEITMAAKATEKPRRQANDLRAFFADGGRVTISLDKLGTDTLSGASENFGKAIFQRTAFQRLQLNIYETGTKESDEEDEFGDVDEGAPEGGRIKRGGVINGPGPLIQ